MKFPDEVNTLGEAIYYLRDKRKMSLRQLARKSGVSPAFMSDLEKGRRGTDRLGDIAKALGCKKTDLEQFDGRLTRDLAEWLRENPDIVRLLRERRRCNCRCELILDKK